MKQVAVFEVKDLSLSIEGRQVVCGLSFVARAGEVMRLTEFPPATATLLAKTLTGLWPSDGGFITLDGAVMTPVSGPYLRRLIAYLPKELPEELAESRRLLQVPIDDEDDKQVIIVEDARRYADLVEKQRAKGKIIIVIDQEGGQLL